MKQLKLVEAMKKTFETIATAKVGTSAVEDTRGLGFLDMRTASPEPRPVLADAKPAHRKSPRWRYKPSPAHRYPRPRRKMMATLKRAYIHAPGEFITEHGQSAQDRRGSLRRT